MLLKLACTIQLGGVVSGEGKQPTEYHAIYGGGF